MDSGNIHVGSGILAEGKDRVGSGTGTFRNKPSVIVIAPPSAQPPRIQSVLKKAGFRVELCALKSLLTKKRPSHKLPAKAVSIRTSPAIVESDGIALAQLRRDLQSRPYVISAMLKVCANLSPGIQIVGFALYDPDRAV
jgi:hypothetical protein